MRAQARRAFCAPPPVQMTFPGARPWRAEAPALNAFLSAAKTAVATAPARAHLFLGNEAADLDSIASAIALAHAHGPPAVPVLNILRGDLPLRRDAAWALAEAGVDAASLVFIDEVDAEAAAALTLVDHNAPASHQQALGPVVGIYDHHTDSGRYADASPRVVEAVGSCATLVREAGGPGNSAAEFLLTCAILADTVNMDATAGRGTARDLAALDTLDVVRPSDRRALFEKLRVAKADQDGLCSRDLLRQDYKEFRGRGGRVGISSVGVGLAAWGAREKGGVGRALEAFRQERGVDCVVVMACLSTDGAWKREILVFGDGDVGAAVRRSVKRAGLELGELDVGGVADGWAFAQGNVRASRKVVGPVVVAALEEMEVGSSRAE